MVHRCSRLVVPSGLEAILGFRLRGNRLQIEPSIPPGWPGYEITYHHGSATYHVIVENTNGTGRGVRSLTLDGQPGLTGVIALADDAHRHEIRVSIAV